MDIKRLADPTTATNAARLGAVAHRAGIRLNTSSPEVAQAFLLGAMTMTMVQKVDEVLVQRSGLEPLTPSELLTATAVSGGVMAQAQEELRDGSRELPADLDGEAGRPVSEVMATLQRLAVVMAQTEGRASAMKLVVNEDAYHGHVKRAPTYSLDEIIGEPQAGGRWWA